MTNSVCEVLLTDKPLVPPPEPGLAETGAVLDFWGVVRKTEKGVAIAGIEYEAFRSMATSQLQKVAEESARQFSIMRITVHHRVGFVPAGEPSLLVRVESRHRAASFDAGAWLIEELKKRVPIWKHPRLLESDEVRSARSPTPRPQGPPGQPRGMNWANRLTVSRLGLTILFVLALNSDWRFRYTIALLLFVVAGVTDYFDGEIARRYQFVTNFGKLMDPLVDKIMIAAAFISLVSLAAIPAWAAIIVVARDFLITGLRLLASSMGNILPAERLGKHKTSWQIATVVFFLVLLAIRELRYVDSPGICEG